ncbi:MAG: TetR/AcrR family transcriptional regulator [Gemmatimonadota bacterium]|nr:TetR/AcrR family transcriptional regulator [Gemmatimonadota bacterium]
MPKVPQAHLDMRRDQILVAARSCFLKKGFHQTTMKDIMGTAKLSAGAVYNYFKSKEDIIVAMAEKVVERNPDFIDPPHPEIADPSLANIFATLFLPKLNDLDDVYATCLNFDLVSEATRNERIRQCGPELMRVMIDPIAALVAQAQATGTLDPDLDREALVRILVGLYFGFVMQKVLEPDLDVAALAQTFFAALTPSAAGDDVKSG